MFFSPFLCRLNGRINGQIKLFGTWPPWYSWVGYLQSVRLFIISQIKPENSRDISTLALLPGTPHKVRWLFIRRTLRLAWYAYAITWAPLSVWWAFIRFDFSLYMLTGKVAFAPSKSSLRNWTLPDFVIPPLSSTWPLESSPGNSPENVQKREK